MSTDYAGLLAGDRGRELVHAMRRSRDWTALEQAAEQAAAADPASDRARRIAWGARERLLPHPGRVAPTSVAGLISRRRSGSFLDLSGRRHELVPFLTFREYWDHAFGWIDPLAERRTMFDAITIEPYTDDVSPEVREHAAAFGVVIDARGKAESTWNPGSTTLFVLRRSAPAS